MDDVVEKNAEKVVAHTLWNTGGVERQDEGYGDDDVILEVPLGLKLAAESVEGNPGWSVVKGGDGGNGGILYVLSLTSSR